MERGHNVNVITSNLIDDRPQQLPKEETIDGIKVRRFYAKSPYPISKLVFTPSLITAISSIEADVIHVFSFLPYFLTNCIAFYAVRKGIPLVLSPTYHPDRQNTHHGIVPFLVKNLYDKRIGLTLLKRANYVMALVPSEAAYYRQKGVSNVCVRWTGTAKEAECSPEELKNFIKKYNLPENTILSLSRIEWRKGIQHIIEAMPLIIKKYPNTKLLVAGGDMGYRKHLEKLCAQTGIRESVVFSGNLNRHQVAAAFEASKIFLLPSYYEILPRTVMEAWIYRKPVIVSNAGGIKDLVSPETGIIISPGDYRAIAEAVIELLSNPARAKTIGEKGYRLVKEQFTWDRVVDKIENVYKNLVTDVNK